jgi:hypothetical protein
VGHRRGLTAAGVFFVSYAVAGVRENGDSHSRLTSNGIASPLGSGHMHRIRRRRLSCKTGVAFLSADGSSLTGPALMLAVRATRHPAPTGLE